jgi:hypothetical protein
MVFELYQVCVGFMFNSFFLDGFLGRIANT